MKNGREPVVVGVADAPLEDGKFVTKASVLGHAALVAKAAVEEAGLKLSDVDGLLTAGAEVHMVHQGRVGWFGVPDRTSLLERLTAASHEAWAGLGPLTEDL